jgi:hypothetical protein
MSEILSWGLNTAHGTFVVEDVEEIEKEDPYSKDSSGLMKPE